MSEEKVLTGTPDFDWDQYANGENISDQKVVDFRTHKRTVKVRNVQYVFISLRTNGEQRTDVS